jgi:hypothetical protein
MMDGQQQALDLALRALERLASSADIAAVPAGEVVARRLR